MFHPQASFYPQGGFQPQNIFNPQGSLYPQGGSGYVPFANTLYGFPQQTPGYSQQTPAFGQGLSGPTNWQQAALQQQAIQQLLAYQLAAQQLSAQIGVPNPAGVGGTGVSPNGAFAGAPAQSSPQHPHLLQQLAQYHHWIAQQLTQLAAQQSFPQQISPQQILQGSASPYAGQFIPSMPGANFVPGITMH
jgi:hypothetical protein